MRSEEEMKGREDGKVRGNEGVHHLLTCRYSNEKPNKQLCVT